MGQGAAMAIEDAVSLATLLPRGTAPHDIPTRLRLYQTARRSRVEFVLHYTRLNGRDGNDETGSRISGAYFMLALAHLPANSHSRGNGKNYGDMFLSQ